MIEYSNASQVWIDFTDKLRTDGLDETDFTDEMKAFFLSFITGNQTESRRLKFASSQAASTDAEDRAVILVHCQDDEYRFDFINNNGKAQLAFIENITIPITVINEMPFSNFTPIPEKEVWIRNELDVSKQIYQYNKFKELLGKEKAITMFLDGGGEFIAARSWVPYFKPHKAFVIYIAWVQSRIIGDDVIIEELSDVKCVIRLKNHLYRALYNCTSHLKTVIPNDEYIELFESIWRDRSECAGWEITFSYEQDDTVLIYTRKD